MACGFRSADPSGLLADIGIGFAIMAFPVFAMQKAISLMSTLMLAAITALSSLFVVLFGDNSRPGIRAAAHFLHH